MSSNDSAAEARRARKAQIRRLARKAMRDEATAAQSIAARDAALIASHGDKRQGLLSYDELAREASVSKGRVIQIVQGKSEYSKSQMADRRAAT